MIVTFLLIVFALSIVFTWTNGFQHASAVAANAVASHAMSKRQLMILIFVFEFLGTMFSGSAVADVIQSLSDWPMQPSLLPLLSSALASAILWNVMARRVKMPASSTHALIGGMIGALWSGAGSFFYVQMGKFDFLHPSGVIGAVTGLFVSPMLGFLVAYLIYSLTILFCLRAKRNVEKMLHRSQWLLVAALAFGDGQNDTQKTMGLLVLALEATGLLAVHQIPIWIHALIGITMGLGAFWINAGLVHELAFDVYELKPANACSAELASACVLVSNSLIGGPVSASQVIAASIMGAGVAERGHGIHVLVIKDIVLSWLVTILANIVLAILIYNVLFRWLGMSLT